MAEIGNFNVVEIGGVRKRPRSENTDRGAAWWSHRQTQTDTDRHRQTSRQTQTDNTPANWYLDQVAQVKFWCEVRSIRVVLAAKYISSCVCVLQHLNT